MTEHSDPDGFAFIAGRGSAQSGGQRQQVPLIAAIAILLDWRKRSSFCCTAEVLQGGQLLDFDVTARPGVQSYSVRNATAEESLDHIGLGFLADPFELRLPDGRWLQVRIAELSAEGIRVTRDDWGAADVDGREFSLPFPIPDELRPKLNRRSTRLSVAGSSHIDP